MSADGSAVPVMFTVPAAAGGQAPVPVTCTAQPGAPFPVGSSIVTCTATDSLSRQASCNFNVTVTVTPRISKMKYLAFGDSITYGRCGPKPNECPPYSVQFEALLRERYTAQSFVVTNSGLPGERATLGQDRLPTELSITNPEVLLLMEGTNDMLATPYDDFVSVGALEDMINLARSRGVTAIFVATIPPIRPGGDNDYAVDRIVPFNARLRDMVARKGAHLVDVYAALNSDLARFYPVDDLHPNGEGLKVIGETFYAAVRAALDTTPTGGGLLSRR
jgi:lysophospholipase L1-like esterase